MLFCVECNIDDLNPELYPNVIERLLDAGALDAWLTPIIMKQGRPAVCLSVLLEPQLLESICELVFSETSTVGLRWYEVERRELARSFQKVETEYGEISIKRAFDTQGRELHSAPEYGDCLKAASESGQPLKAVYRTAVVAYENHKKTMK